MRDLKSIQQRLRPILLEKDGFAGIAAHLFRDVQDLLRLSKRETIVAAALKLPSMFYDGDLIISAPPPARHYTLLHPMHSHMRGGKYRFTPDDQGFLTSAGRYVGREEALRIALASRQPLIDHPSRHATQLFSEDLW